MKSKSQLTKILCLMTCLSSSFAWGALSPGQTQNRIQLEEVMLQAQSEWTNCQYPQLLNQQGIISSSQESSIFAIPSANDCQAASAHFAQLQQLVAAEKATNTPALAFPTFSDTLAIAAQSLPSAAQGEMFLLTTPRKGFTGLAIDAWKIENSLRAQLNVSAVPLNPPATCDLSLLPQASDHIRSLEFWRQLLVSQGYDCTVALFKTASQQLNAQNGFLYNQTQIELEKQIALSAAAQAQDAAFGPCEGDDCPKDYSRERRLDGYHILFFPQLAFDVPTLTPYELLTVDKMQRGFVIRGATFDVIDRVSTSDVETQIAGTKASIDQVLKQNGDTVTSAKGKYIFLARSMGGMAMRELLFRYPEYNQLVKAALLVGCTPWGSVIANYKGRADIYDEGEYQTVTNWFLDDLAGFFNFLHLPKMEEILRAGMNRLAVPSMGHDQFHAVFDDRPESTYPIINLNFVRDQIHGYFSNWKRIPGVDVTMLNMAWYGPTEGSTPLAVATWDSAHSIRLFDNRYNHLGFWEMTPHQGMQFYLDLFTSLENTGVLK